VINEIIELIHTKQYSHLKEILSEMEPFDIAALYDALPEQHMPLLYRLLPKETAAEVFVELDSDSQEMLIKGFSDNELKEVLDELYLDDAVDIIEEMPANVVRRILAVTPADMRQSINQILQYRHALIDLLQRSPGEIQPQGIFVSAVGIKMRSGNESHLFFDRLLQQTEG